jgi:enoyl-CoA hydratase/carnithine racemase
MAVSNLITLPEYAKGFAKEDIRRTVIEMFTQYSDIFEVMPFEGLRGSKYVGFREAVLPQPVIASVQGIATAAGCQLVASCDLAIASDEARFATSGINYGLFCSTPAVALSRNVARKHALEMLYTGDFIDAATAAQIGLINRAVPAAELAAECLTLATKIAAKSTYAIKLGKASFYAQANQPLDAAYRCASADLVRNLLAEDGIEGVDAFFEKRTPQFHQ